MSQRPQVGLGVACMVLTASLFASSDAVIKQLGASFPVLILLWSRYVFQTTVLAGWQCLHRWPAVLRSQSLRLQGLRALLLLGNSTASFFGLQQVPLAEFTALVLLAPVATTVLAALLLREQVSPQRWAMVALGLAGMLLVVRPGNGALGWSALLPVGSALCFAAFQLVTRRISATDDLVTTNLISAALITVVLGFSIWLMPLDVAPVLGQASAVQWLLLLVMGVAATSGHLSMAAAIQAAPLSVLAPFSYAQIVF
ncbi:MAG TPA: DMT family transporter, partial [Ramlibacter sp.]|nr:DMT family transporter [Ramlibacter sp.]